MSRADPVPVVPEAGGFSLAVLAEAGEAVFQEVAGVLGPVEEDAVDVGVVAQRLAQARPPERSDPWVVEAAVAGHDPLANGAVDAARPVGSGARSVPAADRLAAGRAGQRVRADLDLDGQAARPGALDDAPHDVGP